MRAAAIDVGTNSVKLSVAESVDGAAIRMLVRSRVNLQLGRMIERTGHIGREAIDVAAEAVSGLHAVARTHDVDSVAIVGTSAAREAEDSEALQAAIRDACGLDMVLISGEEEARLTWEALQDRIGDRARAAMVDVGGGSTEVVQASPGCPLHVVSMRLGAVRLTERYETADRVGGARLRSLMEVVDRVVEEAVPQPSQRPEVVFGTGGTLTVLALLDLEGEPLAAGAGRSASDVDGHVVDAPFLAAFIRRVAGWTREERAAHTGLSPIRAEIILAGAVVLDRVRHRLQADSIEVHEQGIRDGLLRRLLGNRPGR